MKQWIHLQLLKAANWGLDRVIDTISFVLTVYNKNNKSD